MANITAAEIAAARKRGAEEPTIVSARFIRSTRTLEVTHTRNEGDSDYRI